MDERQWQTSKRPGRMLALREGRVSPRKCRLFTCAVGRLLPCLPSPAENLEREAAIGLAERFGDGLASEAELMAAASCSDGHGRWTILLPDAFVAAEMCAAERQVRAGVKSGLLRCVFGNSFRPVAFTAFWRTPDVVALARAAYEERLMPRGELGPARLAVLADALLDAGLRISSLNLLHQ